MLGLACAVDCSHARCNGSKLYISVLYYRSVFLGTPRGRSGLADVYCVYNGGSRIAMVCGRMAIISQCVVSVVLSCSKVRESVQWL